MKTPAILRTALAMLEHRSARALFSLPHSLQRALAGGRPVTLDGQQLHPEHQLLLALRARLGALAIADGPHERVRRHFRKDLVLHQGPRIKVHAVADHTIDGPAGPIRVRHYAAASARPLLVYLHGGGFVIGDLDTHDAVCRTLCLEANVHVLSVDYRLAPEAPFPAAVEDCLAAFLWARANAKTLGASDRIAIGGDSAGGNLSAVVSQELVRQGQAPAAAQLLLYPTVCRRRARPSLALFARGFMLTAADVACFQKHYAGHTNDEDIRQRPLDGLQELVGTQPPALVVTAGFDPLRDEGDEYAAVLKDKGFVVLHRRIDGFVHGFANMAGVSPASRRVLVDVAKDFASLLTEVPRG